MGHVLVWMLSYHLLGAAEENTKTPGADRQSQDLRKPGVPPARKLTCVDRGAGRLS